MELQRSLRPEFIETPSARETVLYANTASFLFDRLRKDSSAAYVAHELTAKEIVAFLRKKLAEAEGPMDLLWAYVLIAGLSLKSVDDIKSVRDELSQIDLSMVQWGDYLRSEILNKGPRTNVVEITYRNDKDERAGRTNVRTSIAEGRVVNSR